MIRQRSAVPLVQLSLLLSVMITLIAETSIFPILDTLQGLMFYAYCLLTYFIIMCTQYSTHLG